MLAALARAEHRVRIVTPYFLPDNMLRTSLALAAMRGVEVEILFPERSNLRLVQWASWAQLGWLIGSGCTVLLTPPPFDHAKAMTVDGLWSMIGSANWDERSLRLNFEFNVECYSAEVASALDALINQRKANARRVTREEVDNRSLVKKLRDGTAWLASPYL
jgi:cardiolipin synthase